MTHPDAERSEPSVPDAERSRTPAGGSTSGSASPPPAEGGDAGRARRWGHVVLTLLTLAAGAMDAVAFLGLGGVFTANMTGNLVLSALVGREDWETHALSSGLSCVGFCAGLLIGFKVPGHGRGDERWPSAATRLLCADLALQIAFLAGWVLCDAEPGPASMLMLIGVASCAMGLQSAAARRVDLAGITTTFVTGTLTSLFETLASGRFTDTGHRAAVVAALVLGALCASLLLRFAQPWAGAVAPAFTLLALITVATRVRAGR
ncbi:YoaK family protein [Streptosporangium sp. NPDC000396]|uniref:YoaK family protein n=1 Tax=Streptosporangium sp. NPDC000396 TaxID=3366185 RepID=UPI0036D15B65